MGSGVTPYYRHRGVDCTSLMCGGTYAMVIRRVQRRETTRFYIITVTEAQKYPKM